MKRCSLRAICFSFIAKERLIDQRAFERFFKLIEEKIEENPEFEKQVNGYVEKGSTLELIEIANKIGWKWGGATKEQFHVLESIDSFSLKWKNN